MNSSFKLPDKNIILINYINNAKNTLRLLITKKCNSKCAYCYEEGIVGSTNNQSGVLNLDDFKNIIKEAKKIGFKRITISGGEPTLCFDWVEELIKICHEENLSVYLTTNATNRKIVDLAKKYPKLEFRISLDCHSKEQYKYFRGIDNFDKVIDTLQKLSKFNNEIHINRVIVSLKNEWENFSGMIDMINMKGLDKKPNLFLRLIPCYPNKFSKKLEVFDYIKYLSKKIPKLKAKLNQRNFQFLYEFIYKGVKVIIKTRGVYSPKCCPSNKERCVEGIGYIRINPNGLIQPCFGSFTDRINHKDSAKDIERKLLKARSFLDKLYVKNCDKKICKYLLFS